MIQSNFNPHSRKGSDGEGERINTSKAISIHTPARGVTTISSQEISDI